MDDWRGGSGGRYIELVKNYWLLGLNGGEGRSGVSGSLRLSLYLLGYRE